MNYKLRTIYIPLTIITLQGLQCNHSGLPRCKVINDIIVSNLTTNFMVNTDHSQTTEAFLSQVCLQKFSFGKTPLG